MPDNVAKQTGVFSEVQPDLGTFFFGKALSAWSKTIQDRWHCRRDANHLPRQEAMNYQ
jgi:hypothetical protein